VAEWLVWVAIATLALSQTGYFDQDLAGYAFGASGWPRLICVMMIVGATGQLVFRLTAGATAGARAPDPAARRLDLARLAQRGAIFGLPFVFLYATPWLGFYVTAPGFVLALLLVLEVRSVPALLGVTGIVYGLILVLFTRYFFVAVPTGILDSFYEINVAIIDFARLGM
jgi:hypothetical protein